MKRVLVVEDDAIIAMAIEDALNDAGFESASANDAEEAIERGREFQRDVLLSDWRLPGGATAVDVARELQRDNPKLAVIFLTGYSREDLEPELKEFSDAVILVKPFPFEDLAPVINQVLQNGQSELHV